mmetsp:Transcript_4414/g.9833  ORF Transcript_4414/g.9833 Transcript_4414/m.9833 type:complete len:290 (-) Transcript_4414:495-1364(-)
MRHSWGFTVLVLMLSAVSAMAIQRPSAKVTMLDGNLTLPSEGFNPRAAVSIMAEYIKTHPDFVAGVVAWLIAGSIVWLFGFIVFLLSEIGAVLVVRDQDFRDKLISEKYMTPSQGDAYEKLTNNENKKMAPRPYLSAAATLFMFIGTSCLMYPLCDTLSIIGLPSAPCVLLITVGSFLATICNVTCASRPRSSRGSSKSPDTHTPARRSPPVPHLVVHPRLGRAGLPPRVLHGIDSPADRKPHPALHLGHHRRGRILRVLRLPAEHLRQPDRHPALRAEHRQLQRGAVA